MPFLCLVKQSQAFKVRLKFKGAFELLIIPAGRLDVKIYKISKFDFVAVINKVDLIFLSDVKNTQLIGIYWHQTQLLYQVY